jgi:hypothetical protein
VRGAVAIPPTLGATRRDRPATERSALAADHVLYGLIITG